MTMAASSGGHVGIVIEAHDRATRVIRNISNSLRRNLGTSVRSLATSMLSLTAIMGAVGLSLFGVVNSIRGLLDDIQKTNRALALTSVQFRLAGYSAERAAAAVAHMRDNLSRTSLQALPSMDQALRDFLGNLGGQSLKELDVFAQKLADITGVDKQTAFLALAEAAAENFGPLQKLGIYANDFAQALDAIDEGHKHWLANLTPLERAWRSIKEIALSIGTGLAAVFNVLLANPQELADGITSFFNKALALATGGGLQALIDAGWQWAKGVMVGFVEWLLGEDAAKLVHFALEGMWGKAWEKLREMVIGWGQGIATQLREGLGQWARTHLPPWLIKLWDEVMKDPEKSWLERMYILGWNIAKALSRGIAEGATQSLNWALGELVDRANKYRTYAVGFSRYKG